MSKPKVISLFQTEQFESRFLNVPIIGRAVDVFVECLSYDIEIPVNVLKARELDIFEEAILRMIKLKKCSANDLSSILCLEKDLVKFIVIRLVENGLLKDETTISQKGIELLNYQSQLKKEVEYVYGKIFVVKQTGLVLPYIHVGEFQSEAVDDSNASTITIGFGSAGQYRTIKGKRIKCTDYEIAQKNLSANVVKKAINLFNNIASNRSLEQINLSNEYGLLNTQGGNVYFHMKAAVQEGNVDSLIISDGFVPNIDGMLDYFQKYHTDIVSDIKSKAIVMDTTAEVSDHSVNNHTKYKEVYQYYESAKKHIPDIDYENASKDVRDKLNENKKQVIIDCYYAMEWVLYYYLKSHPLSEGLLGLLKKRSVHKNCETIMGLAKKIGIRNVEKYKNLFMHLDGNKIEGVFKYNSPKLYVCLPLAIAEASENSNSNVHSIVHNDSNFLSFMNALNQNSALRHNTETDVIDIDAAEVLRKAEKIISALLPDFIISDSVKAQSTDNVSQLKLIGQISLEKALGSLLYYSMTEGLRNEWLKISPDKKGQALPDLREYIEVLYRIVQEQLKKANSELLNKNVLSQEDAENKCASRYANQLPKSFTKVKLGNYSKAVKCEGSTLGAEALVYYAHIEDEYIEKLNKQGFIDLIDKIISLRGHSELLVLNETESSLNALRDKTITLSKLIGGYYE